MKVDTVEGFEVPQQIDPTLQEFDSPAAPSICWIFPDRDGSSSISCSVSGGSVCRGSYQLWQVQDVRDGGADPGSAGQVPHHGGVGRHPAAAAAAAAARTDEATR